MGCPSIPLAISMCLSSLLTAPSCSEGPVSPLDLPWLRSECGDGALVHHADGRLYLTELSTGQSVFLANGNQPEFSPDGARIAWIDGTRAKGRLRRGDPSIYQIAKGVEPSGGVHWLSDRELAVILRRRGRKTWYRVALDGTESEIPELTKLGTGGYECDIKRGEDGVWSYVARVHWATSDGLSGQVPGTCSVSLSPDGRTVTSLHNPHKKCDLTAIRPGGLERTLWWKFDDGYDNHRFASSDARFLVCVDEGADTMVVMTVDGKRCTRIGTLGRADGGMYGDWASGEGYATQWLEEAGSAASDEEWPGNREDLVFLWDHGQACNTLTTRSPAESLCRVVPRGSARLGRAHEMWVIDGSFVADSAAVERLREDLVHAGEGACELVLSSALESLSCPGTVLAFEGNEGLVFELFQQGADLRLRLTTNADTVSCSLGSLAVGEPVHVVVTWDLNAVLAYRNGREVTRQLLAAPVAWPDRPSTLTFGARADGSHDWGGSLEGLALYRCALGPDDVQAHSRLRTRRLAGRLTSPRFEVVGVLVRKRSLPPADLYPQTLVSYDYRIVKATVGLPLGEIVSVAHWGVLDGRAQASVDGRRLEDRFRLQLEPWAAHDELQRYKLVAGDLAPAYFDVTPSSTSARLPAD